MGNGKNTKWPPSALILIQVHYFVAESSEKINCYRQNAQNNKLFKKQMAAILYLSLTKIVLNLKAHITSRLIYKHISIEKPWPKCRYMWGERLTVWACSASLTTDNWPGPAKPRSDQPTLRIERALSQARHHSSRCH